MNQSRKFSNLFVFQKSVVATLMFFYQFKLHICENFDLDRVVIRVKLLVMRFFLKLIIETNQCWWHPSEVSDYQESTRRNKNGKVTIEMSVMISKLSVEILLAEIEPVFGERWSVWITRLFKTNATSLAFFWHFSATFWSMKIRCTIRTKKLFKENPITS